MPEMAILIFALLCYLTLLFLRWLLRPIWPTGKETGRTQFFICDYLVLVLEIGAAMSAFGHPQHYSSNELVMVAMMWASITALWFLCCRALSLMHVTRTVPRVVGLILLPLTIAAVFGNTAATILFVFFNRHLDPTFYICWASGFYLSCLFIPCATDWIAASARSAPNPPFDT